MLMMAVMICGAVDDDGYERFNEYEIVNQSRTLTSNIVAIKV